MNWEDLDWREIGIRISLEIIGIIILAILIIHFDLNIYRQFNYFFSFDFVSLSFIRMFFVISWSILTFIVLCPYLFVPGSLYEITNQKNNFLIDEDNLKHLNDIFKEITIAGVATIFIVISILWTKRGGKDIIYCSENSIILLSLMIYFVLTMYFIFIHRFLKKIF